MLHTRPRTTVHASTEADSLSLPVASSGATTVARLVVPEPTNSTPRSPAVLLSPRILSFLIVVVFPIAAGAIYYLAIAADQYVAEFRMTLRRVEAPQIAPLQLVGGDLAQSTAASE